MRLSVNEINNIKYIITNQDPDAEIRLFGSRVDDNASGGDIDLIILSDVIKLHHKLIIRYKLKEILGNRKFDIIVTSDPVSNFDKIAYNNSVLL